MKKKYIAKIIDLKPTNKPGYFIPVFQYKNRDGKIDVREGIKNELVQLTPFTFNKECTIYTKKKETKAYPKRWVQMERELIVLFFMLPFGFDDQAFATLVLTIFISLCCLRNIILLVIRQQKIKNPIKNAIKIPAKIIDYYSEKKNDNQNTTYYPIMEYEYQGETYQHVGKIAEKDESRLGGSDTVFIVNDLQDVFDEAYINLQCRVPWKIRNNILLFTITALLAIVFIIRTF